MKIFYQWCVISLLLILTFSLKAQVHTSPRSALFGRYANKLPTKPSELDKAFYSPVGTEIKFNFSNLDFTGIITSIVNRSKNLSSVIIKSASLNNSVFSISKKINVDKTVTYIGRIINEKYADGYEIIKDSTGNYTFNKIKTESILQDY